MCMASIDSLLEHLTPEEIIRAVILSRPRYRFTEEDMAYGFRKGSETYSSLQRVDAECLHNALSSMQTGCVIEPTHDSKNLRTADAMYATAVETLAVKSYQPDILKMIEPVSGVVWAYAGMHCKADE
jgi:hypothetical protein